MKKGNVVYSNAIDRFIFQVIHYKTCAEGYKIQGVS